MYWVMVTPNVCLRRAFGRREVTELPAAVVNLWGCPGAAEGLS